MFLRAKTRIKDGKEHRYWSIVESRRCTGGRVVQRPVLYLGEINDGQREAWCRQIEAFDEASGRHRQLALFPAERAVPDHAKGFGVQVRLDAMELHRPRQWGACWLACHLYEQLELDRFFAPLLPDSREGTNWQHILQTLVCYRLIDPGSEWRLHRQWFEQSAMGDLLGADYALVEKNALYRCLDKLLEHKAALFSHLRRRWQDLFGASFEVLLYDLTSTYFESALPENEEDKRRYGYSRDKRSDCVQVVIALIVTPEGFPIAYEVLPGNTADCTTLRNMLHKIEAQYGKANRIWVMDRGIPTEAVLEIMRQADPPVSYVVGTPKGPTEPAGAATARAAMARGSARRPGEAAAAGRRALRVRPERRSRRQGAHPSTATSLNNLAVLLRAQGDLAGARPLFEWALAIREKASRPPRPMTS